MMSTLSRFGAIALLLVNASAFAQSAETPKDPILNQAATPWRFDKCSNLVSEGSAENGRSKLVVSAQLETETKLVSVLSYGGEDGREVTVSNDTLTDIVQAGITASHEKNGVRTWVGAAKELTGVSPEGERPSLRLQENLSKNFSRNIRLIFKPRNPRDPRNGTIRESFDNEGNLAQFVCWKTNKGPIYKVFKTCGSGFGLTTSATVQHGPCPLEATSL